MLRRELIRLAIFAGLIAKIEDPKEEDYIYLWRKAENLAKRVLFFERRHRDFMRAVKRQASSEREGEP